MELFFEARTDITKLDGKVRWIQQRPRVTQQPVLEPSNSGDGAGALIYGTVLYDGGRYRMWYQGWPRDWNGSNSAIVCHAESDDGVTWKKPTLKLDDRFEGAQNVTDLGVHSPAIFIDPHAPASHRYRATGHTRSKDVGFHRGIEAAGYRTAHSADGLHWTMDQALPTWPGADVITSIYHPAQKRAIVALKHVPRQSGIRRRSIWNSELRDGQWQGQWCAIVPDEFDDICAQTRGLASGDYYGMAMQAAGSGTAGFIWQFRHSLPRTQSTSGDGAGVFGVVDVSLAWQADARSTWLHTPGRIDFINNSDIPWRPGGCIYTASAPVEVGDEHRLYLCATYPHGWYIDAQWKVIEEAKAKLIRRGVSQIGYAYWPKYRLFGYRAEPVGSIDLNLGQLTKPCKLILNCEMHNRDGFVKVAVNGSDTRTHDLCQPLTGDHLASIVQWNDGPIIQPRPEGSTTINIAMTEATVWGWELREV